MIRSMCRSVSPNCICGSMVNVLTTSVVDRDLESPVWSNQAL